MEHEKLINELYLCEAHCHDCFREHSHDENGKLVSCMMLVQDCADICHFTAKLLKRNSESAGKLLNLCAQICLDCASTCDKFKYERCGRCAAIARKCSEMCIAHQYHIET